MTTVYRNGRATKSKAVKAPRAAGPLRVAFYVRVSTEDQGKAGTPRNQIDALERSTAPHLEDGALEPWAHVATFIDEGVSGAVPFEDRPDGSRALELARAGELDLLLFLKLDRFGRSVIGIYDAAAQLDRYGCAINSITEHFETRSTYGKAMFGLLAVFAELERDTIRDRMALGRDRVARAGRYINGVLPFGYDVREGVLAPSERRVEGLDMAEADLARLVFEKVASGEYSGLSVAQWLTACGVPSEKVWVTKDGTRSSTAQYPIWLGNRISRMIHNPIYKGTRTLHHASGDIAQDVAALVDARLWQRANEMLGNTSKKGGLRTRKTKTFTYLLGGRIFCASCEAPMQGNLQRDGKAARLYYGCARAPGKRAAARHGKCQGLAYAPGDLLEAKVISDVDRFMADPASAVDALRQRVRERQAQGAEQETLAERMQEQLRELENRKHKLLGFVVNGRITDDDAERHLAEIARETATLRAELDSTSARTTIAQNLEERLIDLTRTLETAQQRWQEARASNNREALREVIGLILGSVRVHANQTASIDYLTTSLSATKFLDYAPSKDGPVAAELALWGRAA